jgi:hypothetical protein
MPPISSNVWASDQEAGNVLFTEELLWGLSGTSTSTCFAELDISAFIDIS